jgi:hypothetical protein
VIAAWQREAAAGATDVVLLDPHPAAPTTSATLISD